MSACKIGVISDIHYACAAEKARGDDYELRGIRNAVLRGLVHMHRNVVWMRNPLQQGYLVDKFLAEAVPLDYLVANGDYSCDSGFVGVSDAAVRESVEECLGKLRSRFGDRLRAVIGDHELGKRSFVGGKGGMRLASWEAATGPLGIEPCWRLEAGRYTLVGIVSSLTALPVFRLDTLPEEYARWEALREAHLAEIRGIFASLDPGQRVLLFCHDPTALPFLKRDAVVGSRLGQIEQTFVGHLHTGLVLWASRWLAAIPFLWLPGHTGKRMASALREARHWRDFRVRLCPALGGIELLKDGGYLVVELDPEGKRPAVCRFHRVRRRPGTHRR